jgi:aminopeptidase N
MRLLPHRTVAAAVVLLLTGTTAALVPAAGAVPAAEQPTARSRYDAGLSTPQEDSYYPGKGDPGVDTLHYGLRLGWHPRPRLLNGTATITLRATADADDLQLDLASRLEVDRLTLDGKRVRFTHTGKTLRVQAPVRADRRYRLVVRYHGSPRPTPAPSGRSDMIDGLGWHTERDGQVWAMQEPYGAFTWYPVNDQPSDKALYDVRLDVPRRWVGVSNGRMVSRRATQRRTVTRFHSGDPMASYLVTVAIGPYRRVTQKGPRDLPLTYWVPRAHPEYLEPLRKTPGAIRFLESMFGPYPFDRAGVVVTPSDSAMETQTLVTMGEEYFRRGNDRQVRETVLHELAHQWYGDTVTPTDWRDLWMNEGMAMYAQARWTVAQGWRSWRSWRRAFEDPFWRDVYGPPGKYDRHDFGEINVYYCTAAMWDALRRRLGDEQFAALIRAWPQQHRNAGVARDDFVGWVEARTGLELSAFFREWLMSPTAP